jgi:predicted O-methyltransferase YrrM
MSQEQWTEVDQYITDALVPPDATLEGALAASEAAGLPPIHVAANQGKFLMLLAQIIGARKILELGTLGGYSTLWLARALPPGGSLITLEFDPERAEVARGSFARAGLQEVIDLRVGAALDTLPQIAAEGHGPFDFIFIDADKQNYPGYFAWALKLSRPGTVIIADNVVRNGEVTDPDSPDDRVQAVRRFYELVKAEPRVNATAIQTVGNKGYDGFAILRVLAL